MPAFDKIKQQKYTYTKEDILARFKITVQELNKELKDGDTAKVIDFRSGDDKKAIRKYSREFYKRLSKKYNINKCWGKNE